MRCCAPRSSTTAASRRRGQGAPGAPRACPCAMTETGPMARLGATATRGGARRLAGLPGGAELLARGARAPRHRARRRSGTRPAARAPRRASSTSPSPAAQAELRRRCGSRRRRASRRARGPGAPGPHQRFGTASVDRRATAASTSRAARRELCRPGALPRCARDDRGGPRAARLHRQRDLAVARRVRARAGCWRSRTRSRISARALRVLHERSFSRGPYAAAAPGPLCGAAVLRGRAAHARAGAGGARGGRHRHGLRRARRRELRLVRRGGRRRGLRRAGRAGRARGARPAGRLRRRFVRAGARAAARGRPVASCSRWPCCSIPRATTGRRRGVAAAQLMDELEFPAESASGCAQQPSACRGWPASGPAPARPSELRELLAGVPLEGVAIAGALAERRSPGAPARAGAAVAGRARATCAWRSPATTCSRRGRARGPGGRRRLAAALAMQARRAASPRGARRSCAPRWRREL